MIGRSCFQQRTAAASCSLLTRAAAARHFHASAGRSDERGMPNHYETLDIATTATGKEIKSQFYKLSKANHPDLHPDDETASQKFVKISEAYATLGSAEKRQRYDRDFLRSQEPTGSSSSGRAPQGSYSSASSGPGGRPASGLSRRRTQFRGPPPSFYRSGGWGEHGAKRAEHANKASDTSETRGESASGPAGPGMGPGGFAMGFDGDVPHFNNRAHTQTHSEIERRHRARRQREVRRADADLAGSGSSMLFNFLLLSGILTFVMGISNVIYGSSSDKVKEKTNNS